LDVARINVDKHGLQQRITLLASDGLASVRGPYDLIVCNPPYVNAASMAALPPEYHAEPALALAETHWAAWMAWISSASCWSTPRRT
jgi:ribosomal protein L3 glutamine methyltransferase